MSADTAAARLSALWRIHQKRGAMFSLFHIDARRLRA
jgi:hypothetical protein